MNIKMNRHAAKWILSTLVASVLVTSIGSVAHAVPAPTPSQGKKVSKSLFGIQVIGAENGVWPTVPVGSLRIWDNASSWSTIEKKPGQFNWTNLDAVVANAQAHHAKSIMYVLGSTPQWASDRISKGELPTLGASGMPRSISWWDRWVREVVTRYKGRITSYQVWNEMNLKTFFAGQPWEMALLTEHAYKIIKEVDPGAEVVAASTGTRWQPGFLENYPPYLDALKKRNWPIDAFSAHFYPEGSGNPTSRNKLIEQWREMLSKAGAPKKPLYETEINFGLAGPSGSPDQDINGQRAADWVARTYLDTLRYGLDRAYWYAWSPEGDLLGIQMQPNTPGANAMGALEGWLKGTRLNRCATEGMAVTCTFKKGKQTQSFMWSDRGPLRFKAPQFAREVCTSEGVCQPTKAGATIKTRGPVRFSS